VWQRYKSEDGRTYFANESTGETQWDKPPDFDPNDLTEEDDDDDDDSDRSDRSGGAHRRGDRRLDSLQSEEEADFDDLPLSSLRRAVGIADFMDPSPDQLSFEEGDELVVQPDDPGWWLAKRVASDSVGWVPSSFIEVTGPALESDRGGQSGAGGAGGAGGGAGSGGGTGGGTLPSSPARRTSRVPPPVPSRGGKPASPASSVKFGGGGGSGGSGGSGSSPGDCNDEVRKYSLMDVKRLRDTGELKREALEDYLIVEDFVVVFQMQPSEFRALPKWKQISKKKTAGLF